jgi:hypothetical protein
MTSTVSKSMSYGILIGFVIGGILGYSTHDFTAWLGAGFIFGLSGGIIVGMVIDRRKAAKSRVL